MKTKVTLVTDIAPDSQDRDGLHIEVEVDLPPMTQERKLWLLAVINNRLSERLSGESVEVQSIRICY